MKNTRHIFLFVLVLVLVVFMSPLAMAQHGDEHNDEDYSTTPLIQPTVEDFAPAPEPEVGEDGKPLTEAPIGVNGYFEVSDKQKIFSLTPSYRFSEKFAMKARLPFVVERTRTYWNGEESSSGIGDIGLEGEYTHRFEGPSKLLRMQATVKLPTGDNENVVGDDEVRIPLGTGSLDLMVRGQYTQSTQKSSLLASALFRINSSGESVYQTIDYADNVNTETNKTTNGNEFVASVFGRHVVGNGFWLNLGLSLMKTGNGDNEYTLNTDPTITSELVQKSTLIDIYPGVSYKFGPVTPYLGARVPLSTSYDNTFLLEERDTVFIFQLTYRPFAMVD